MNLRIRKINSTRWRIKFKNLKALVLFVEKMIVGLPGAIKEKERTQNQEGEKNVQNNVTEGNEVIIVVAIQSNLVANKY